MELTALTLVGFVVFLTGISKSAFGGALGVFYVPLLMLQLSPLQAIGIMLPILIIADVIAVKSHWRQWDNAIVKALLPGAVFGVLIAHFLIDSLNEEILKNVIATLCILFSFKAFLFPTKDSQFLKTSAGAFTMSGVASISSTMVHAGGPPLIAYLSALRLKPQTFVATSAVFFAAMNAMKLVGYVSIDLLDAALIIQSLYYVPIALFGNWLGLRIRERIAPERFRTLINSMLFILGVILFVK